MSVATETKREHQLLLGEIHRLLAELNSFQERIHWGSSTWLPDLTFFDYLALQTSSLQVARDLAIGGHYRDAYNSIRQVLEGYLTLRLVTECLLYPRTFRIRRAQGDPNIAHAKARFRSDIADIISSGKRPDIIREWRELATDKTITLIFKGIQVNDTSGEPTGEYVSFYAHLWGQYDPMHHVLGKRTNPRRWLVPGWAPFSNRRAREQARENRDIYRGFFTFDRIVDHLRLNEVLNQKTATRLFVHYNYLSSHSHNTYRSYQQFTRNVPPSSPYDHYHSELCLLYILHLSAMFLEFAIRYCRRRQLKVADLSHTRLVMQEATTSFDYFWFIFNDPHEFDYITTANRKSDYLSGLVFRSQDIKRAYVRYYEDPLRRLIDMHTTSRELTTGNVYHSPFERSDASYR